MSKIILNSITTNRSTKSDPMNYIGAIVDSKSGYLDPMLFTSIQQLNSILGDFKYSSMYRELISNDIPVCLLPIVTPESRYNLCSLRLSPSTSITSCNPKYGKLYSYKLPDELISDNYTRVINETSFYGLLLDFTNVDLKELQVGDSNDNDELTSNYIIVNTGKPSGDQGNTWDQLISTDLDYNVSSSDYDLRDNSPIYIKLDLEDNKISSQNKQDYINNLKIKWNSPKYRQDTSSICKSLDDLVMDYIQKFITRFGLPAVNIMDNRLNINDWVSKLIDESFKEDFYIYDNKYIKSILIELTRVYLGEYAHLLNETSLKSRLTQLAYPNEKLLLLFDYPAINLNHFKLPGLIYTPVTRYSHDRLCEYTNRDKVIEFYSKIKGPVGKDITISINKHEFKDNVYDLIISNGVIIENFTVKLFDLDSSNVDVIHITELDRQSQLVNVFIYNYWYGESVTKSDNQYLIDDRYFNQQDFDVNYYPENKRSEKELILPIGEFRLGRFVDEPIDNEDILNSLSIFKSSQWYPDLLLIPDLINDTSYIDAILDAIDTPIITSEYADYSASSMYSQALINLNSSQLNPEWFTRSNSGKDEKLKSKNNRLLYFFGNVTVNGELYPAFYPYIYNLLEQSYLEYPSKRFSYDPFTLAVGNTLLLYLDTRLVHSCEVIFKQDVKGGTLLELSTTHSGGEKLQFFGLLSADKKLRIVDPKTLSPINNSIYSCRDLESYLNTHQINYLKFDNMKYYWESIKEPLDQSDVFMIRFISSKYVRETYKKLHHLVGNTEIGISSIIGEINRNCTTYLKYVSNSEYEVLYNREDPNIIKVTYTLTIPKLVNKVYKLDIILNT